MSREHGLVAFAVRLEQLAAFWGCRDASELERLQSLTRRPGSESAVPPEGEPPLPLEQALAELCRGELSRPETPRPYVLALKHLCEHLGAQLPGPTAAQLALDELRSLLDPVMAAAGFGERATDEVLLGAGWPLPIPEDGSLPRGGTLRQESIQSLLGALRNAPVPAGTSLQSVKLLGDVRGWLEMAATQQAGLVCFYQ
jgi:hypothetical protein